MENVTETENYVKEMSKGWTNILWENCYIKVSADLNYDRFKPSSNLMRIREAQIWQCMITEFTNHG